MAWKCIVINVDENWRETVNLVDGIGRDGDLARLWRPETIGAIAALPAEWRDIVMQHLRFFFGSAHSPAALAQAVASQLHAIRKRAPRPPIPRELRWATEAERAAWLADRAPADVPMVQANRASAGQDATAPDVRR